ncbi:hypothetical protein KCH_76150 [Kitasatospora cheerisanensis KCTC 2395]|uniref:Uncharacterized protein n=1 Tax=Kitasatospora cheerisanensis KCTC 2395 TaxID=1348663 RepID=A0A066YL31_9ACTN|nr:hypothetical protein KCH_76150 [Kitasatospora cheerisanensis KCTC 2395]
MVEQGGGVVRLATAGTLRPPRHDGPPPSTGRHCTWTPGRTTARPSGS